MRPVRMRTRAHFRDRVLPELRRVPGFAGASLARRALGDRVEFLVLTRWYSMDAIRGFAGDDPARAVVEPGAVAALIDFDQIGFALRGRRGHIDSVAAIS